ncbi:carbohydrate ABC transporter permease [Paenibacillus mendelii]|uniref:Carbohydrate ABC transporter permease n=1 Tax=Paenibacillus mendelii TaxID=206163 RepID=A0ABV6J4K2_9BACL|nr:carbohydrate ABC transporter permease [Paenibacillus mendelii]MCQ6561730.1 carbohydrate ABC transporter permease [Paenibacillus mendelii]
MNRKHYKPGLSSRIFDAGNYLFLIGLCIIMLYPLVNTLAVSLSKPEMIIQGEVSWIPRGFNLEGYKYILSDSKLLTAFGNTVIYAGVGTFIMLLLTSMMAYPLTLQNFVLRKFTIIFLTITMFFGGGLIPTYLLIRKLHMLDTLWVMVIPGSISAFNVILFRTFFRTIPKELGESAYMDGANDFRILFQIYLPISKALLATFGLFGIVGAWNGWFDALIYLNNEDKYPIQMILRKMIIETDNSAMNAQTFKMMSDMKVHSKNIKMAAVIVTIVPMLLLYPFLQKHFATGMMIGSIKG